MSQDSRKKLRDQLAYFIYESFTNPDLMNSLHRHKSHLNEQIKRYGIQEMRENQNLNQKEQLKLNITRYVRAFKIVNKTSEPDRFFRRVDFIIWIKVLTLNTAAFLETLELLGDDQQSKKWRNSIINGQVFGGYGQTQLGHGSNVQGLETQAHYDEKKQVFIVNSPKTTSAKFWPAVVGLVATHCVIQAKTFVKGKSIGLQTFIIEMRDQNLKNLPGIKAGDLGPKFGFIRVDNGYLMMQNVQTPRDTMLMKYVQVTEEGQVKGLQNKAAIKYAYGSMLNLRAQLANGFSLESIVFPSSHFQKLLESLNIHNETENKKMMIEMMCTAYGMITANNYTKKLFQNFKKQLNSKNYSEADKFLANCHILSSTFKALSSWKVIKLSTQMAIFNQHTTLRTTKIPQNFINVIPSSTYQGDNEVLLQQTGKFLMMTASQEQPKKPNLTFKDDDIEALYKTLKFVCFKEVARLKHIFEKEFESGGTMNTIWNEKHQRHIIEVSKLWGVMMFAKGFLVSIEAVRENNALFRKVGKVFCKKLLEDAPQIHFYGFEAETTDSWKLFTPDEYWAITHLKKPIQEEQLEDHKILPRKGDWINAKL